MEIDWDRYQRSYLYRFRVSLHYLEKQSESLKQRFIRAAKWSLARSSAIVLAVVVTLYLMEAQARLFGIAFVGIGASILAWTAFRVHEESFREAALVPEKAAKDDTLYQARVSMTSLNYVDALIGVVLVMLGFTLRVVSLLS